MRRAEVIEKLNNHSKQLAEQYGISALYLFGSVARDEDSIASDVDLMVDFSDPVGLFDFVALKHDLEAILSCPIDLGTKRSLKRDLQDMIESETIRVV